MINQQVLDGNWHELSGKLKAKWEALTDDDLRTFDGNVAELVDRIQQQTGEPRELIEQFFDQLTEKGSGVFSAARAKFQETVGQAADGARHGCENLRQGYAQAEKAVQKRPGQAVAIAFGLGLLGGFAVTVLVRGQRH